MTARELVQSLDVQTRIIAVGSNPATGSKCLYAVRPPIAEADPYTLRKKMKGCEWVTCASIYKSSMDAAVRYAARLVGSVPGVQFRDADAADAWAAAKTLGPALAYVG